MSKLRTLLRGLIAEEVLLSEAKVNVPFKNLNVKTEIHYNGAVYEITRIQGNYINMHKIKVTKSVGSMYQPKATLEKRNYESQVKMGFIKDVNIYK